MANRAIWSVRKRHEWLSSPHKTRKMKRSGRKRIGLQDALDRKGIEPTPPPTKMNPAPAQGNS